MERKTSRQVSWVKKALPITIAVLMLSIPAIAMAGEIIPDEDTVLLDHLNGTTLGTAFGPLAYVDSLPNLDKAVDLVPGTYIRYDLTPWYSTYWGGVTSPPDPSGTVEFWIKPRSYGSYRILEFQWFLTYSYIPYGHILEITMRPDGRLLYSVWGCGPVIGLPLIGATTLPLDEWTHVAVSWGPPGTKMYVNGIVDIDWHENLFPAMGWYGRPYVYVYLNPWGGHDVGYIDELHISKIQRTDEEIWLHYYQATPRWLKLDAIKKLEAALTLDPGDDDLIQAIDYLHMSLGDDRGKELGSEVIWIDDWHIDEIKGVDTFQYEEAASDKLDAYLLNDENIDTGVAPIINTVKEKLYEADRLLAEKAIEEAEAAGGVPTDIDKAKELYQQAVDTYAVGTHAHTSPKLSDVMDLFEEAWEKAAGSY